MFREVPIGNELTPFLLIMSRALAQTLPKVEALQAQFSGKHPVVGRLLRQPAWSGMVGGVFCPIHATLLDFDVTTTSPGE